jgi:thiamine-monophosphate kinase
LPDFVLNGGDDYELVFTAPVSARADVLQAAKLAQTPVTRIGTVTIGPQLVLLDAQGQPVALSSRSFDHFA